MAEHCGRRFEEALLSGYLDGALTQGDEQQVRIHLEDCEACRAEVGRMTALREVTMSSTFKTPAADEWSEAPRSAGSRLSFGLGWIIAIVWAAGLAGFGVWQLATSDGPLLPKLLAFGALTGLGLLLLSVGLDRLKARKTDRYRRVQR